MCAPVSLLASREIVVSGEASTCVLFCHPYSLNGPHMEGIIRSAQLRGVVRVAIQLFCRRACCSMESQAGDRV
jgi:hypothetical protein